MRRVQESTRIKIVESAKKLFLEKSIALVTIQDISKDAKIGEATVYRYFGKKLNLVIDAAISISKEVTKEYFIFNEDDSGYETIKKFYNVYLYVFEKNKSYFKFLNDFDSYLEQEPTVMDEDYEHSINNFKDLFNDAYNKGLKDKTLKEINDINTFYYSTTIALLNLCKKLSKDKTILKSDLEYDGKDLIKRLIDIILESIKGGM